MKNKKLIEFLQQLPEDVNVCINDVRNGNYHEKIEKVFLHEGDGTKNDPNEIVIIVNSK